MVESIFNTKKAKNIVLHDTRENLKLQILQIDGNTVQNSTSGKNLLDCSGLTEKTISGVTFTPIYENGLLQYINVNGTPTGTDIAYYNLSTTFNSKEFEGCIFSGLPTTGSATTFLYRVSASTSSRVSLQDFSTENSIVANVGENLCLAIRISNGYTANNLKFYPMIRLATITDSTYEPFTNGASPNPDYPQEIKSVEVSEIKSVGKNLLDCSGLTEKTISGVTFTPIYEKGLLQYINVNGTATAQTTFGLTNITDVPADEMFVNGCDGGSSSTYSILISYRDENDKWKAEDYQTKEQNSKALNQNYAKFDLTILVRNGITMNNVKFYPMIRLASVTDATYEPHTESKATLSEPITLNGFGGVCDYIDLKRGVKVQKFKTIKLTSDMKWFYNTNSGKWVYLDSITDFMRVEANATGDKIYGNAMCNMAIYSKTFYSDEYGFSLWHAEGGYVGDRLAFRNEYTIDIDTWKTYLDYHEVYVTYELAEPIETPLSDADVEALKSLETFEGLTYVVFDSEINPKSISVLYELLQYRIDWTKTDFFNAVDYNRIIGNIAYLKAYLDSLFLGLTNISTMEEKTFESLLYAREINAIETALETLNLETYKFDIGETKEYLPNTRTIDFVELNRIESAILLLFKTMTAQKNALPRLAFTLGGQKGMRV